MLLYIWSGNNRIVAGHLKKKVVGHALRTGRIGYVCSLAFKRVYTLTFDVTLWGGGLRCPRAPPPHCYVPSLYTIYIHRIRCLVYSLVTLNIE